MIVLAGDTSSASGSLALFKISHNFESNLIESSRWEKNKSHSDVISYELENLLKKANIKLSQIDYFCSGTGPGSFTGIRVALNLIRGLGFLEQKECLGVSSPEMLIQPLRKVKDKKPILVMINAFRNLVYCQTFDWNEDKIEASSKLEALTIDECLKRIDKEHLCIGSGFTVFKSRIPEDKMRLLLRTSFSDEPCVTDIGPFLSEKVKNLSFFNWKELTPLYIRDSEAEEKLRTGELKPVNLL